MGEKTNRGLLLLDHLHQPQRTETGQEIVVWPSWHSVKRKTHGIRVG
jgi:hypothetical protein